MKEQLKLKVMVLPEMELTKLGEKHYFHTKAEAEAYVRTLVETDPILHLDQLKEGNPVIVLLANAKHLGGLKAKVTSNVQLNKERLDVQQNIGTLYEQNDKGLLIQSIAAQDGYFAYVVNVGEWIASNFTGGVFSVELGNKKLEYVITQQDVIKATP